MALELVQGASATINIGPLVDSAGTPNSGLTITAASIWVSKNGAAFALKSHSSALAASSLGLGFYECLLDDTDLGTYGNLQVYLNYSGVLPAWENYHVVPAKKYTVYAQLNALAASLALTAYDAPTNAEVSAALTAIDAQLKAQAASTALTAYDGPTNAEISAALTAVEAQMVAQAASTALTAYDAPTNAEISAALTAIDAQLKAQAASSALTAYDPPTKAEMDALAASSALTAYDPPTKAEVDALAASLALAAYDPATPVWAALRASHTTSSSFGALLPSGIEKNKQMADMTFLMVDSTDHRTPKTGLTSSTMTIYVSKDASAYGAIAGTFDEISNGTYQLDAAAADMNGNKVTFRCTATGADDTFMTFFTIKTVSG